MFAAGGALGWLVGAFEGDVGGLVVGEQVGQFVADVSPDLVGVGAGLMES